jgi:hypothetical protein
MGKHLRKLFSVDHVKEVFQRYLSREIAVDQASAMLKIRRRQFFKLLKVYIDQARQVLYEELHQYNYKRVHSTTGEIPVLRYERALEENRGLFRRFEVPRPYQTLDDIFCYRFKRTVDPYRKVSWNALQFNISGVPIREEVELRISFNLKTRLALIRFWYQGKLVGQQQVKADDLKKVHF